MIKNHLISAWMASPIAGDPPELDSILAWELSCRLGAKSHGKTGRWTPISELENMPIPLAKRTINGHDVYCCSAPILSPLLAPEWVDRVAKRFETSKMALYIAPEHRKSVMTASGPYKSRFAPERVRLVERVCWFARGDRVEINKLLKSVYALGRRRNIGYGHVWQWTFDEQVEDYSIFAPHNGKLILMRTLPAECVADNVCGYRHSYGGAVDGMPKWLPAFNAAVVMPC